MLITVILASCADDSGPSLLDASTELLGYSLLEHALEAVAPLQPDHNLVVLSESDLAESGILKSERPSTAGESATELTELAARSTYVPTRQAGRPAGALRDALTTLETLVDAGQIGTATCVIVHADTPLLDGERLQSLVEEQRAFGKVVYLPAKSPSTNAPALPPGDTDVAAFVAKASTVRGLAPASDSASSGDAASAAGPASAQSIPLTAALLSGRGGGRPSTLPPSDKEQWHESGTRVRSLRDLAAVAVALEERLLDAYLENNVTIVDRRNTHIEKGVAIGPGSLILPFTVLRRGVVIGRDCDVGPFAHLRAGTRLCDGASIGNFVEIKNSEIGQGSKARHLTYVGDGTVGDNVNIGAGTIFANYDGKKKHPTVVKDGAFVGSGTVLVAPVTIGAGAVTGAGAVVLRNRDVDDGDVVAGVPAKSVRNPSQPQS